MAVDPQQADGADSAPQRLDLRGLHCPLPLLRTKLALNALAPGAEVEVLASDPGSWRDIPAWLAQTDHRLLFAEERGDVYCFRIRKHAAR